MKYRVFIKRCKTFSKKIQRRASSPLHEEDKKAVQLHRFTVKQIQGFCAAAACIVLIATSVIIIPALSNSTPPSSEEFSQDVSDKEFLDASSTVQSEISPSDLSQPSSVSSDFSEISAESTEEYGTSNEQDLLEIRMFCGPGHGGLASVNTHCIVNRLPESIIERMYQDSAYWAKKIRSYINGTLKEKPVCLQVIEYYNISKQEFIDCAVAETRGDLPQKSDKEIWEIAKEEFLWELLYCGDEETVKYYYKPLHYLNYYIGLNMGGYSEGQIGIKDQYKAFIDDAIGSNEANREQMLLPWMEKDYHHPVGKPNFSLITFAEYFQISKDKFITLTEKYKLFKDVKAVQNLNYSQIADILYSGDKKLIYQYFSNPDLETPDYDANYYAFYFKLWEYAGYQESGSSLRISGYEGNMRFVKWQLQYKNQKDGINIVNFVKDHNIPKEKFIELTKDCPYDYNADVIYSGDQKLIDEYYKLR